MCTTKMLDTWNHYAKWKQSCHKRHYGIWFYFCDVQKEQMQKGKMIDHGLLVLKQK